MKFALLLGFFVNLVALNGAESAIDLSPRIETLLLKLEKSPCKFIRNGSEYSGKEAAEHIRTKYNHFKNQIHTLEDFVAKCATKSELSGKPYMVKLEDGQIVRSDNWMKKMLGGPEKSAK